MSLKDQVEKFREETIQKAGKSIEGLASIAIILESPVSEKLKKLNAQLKSDTFNLIIAGRFNNGKSTLMNTLLGRTTHSISVLDSLRDDDPSLGPMPTEDLACTATLTGINYSPNPFVRVWFKDGAKEDWTFTRYLSEARLSGNLRKDKEKFSNIRQFEVGYPSSLCKAGVTLYDSPGMDEDEERTKIARECTETCDAAIVIYKHDSLASESERKFINENLLGKKTKIFYVINVMNDRKIDERLKGAVWNKLFFEQSNPEEYSGQDFSVFNSKGVFFVNVLNAYFGVMNNDQEAIQRSGLAVFEEKLGEFLINDKHLTHIKSFIDKSDVYGGELMRNVELRKESLKTDTGVLLQAYEKIKPKLSEIHSKKGKLPEIFDRYAYKCERELLLSVKDLIRQISNTLPNAVQNKKLPTLDENSWQIANPFKQNQLVRESLDLCKNHVELMIKGWEENTVNRILEPIISDMRDHINEQIISFERDYGDIHFELTGFSPNAQEFDNNPKWGDRIISGGIGMLIGGPGGFAAGSVGGWKGLSGALAAQLVAGIILGILGVTSLPVIAIAGIIAAIFGAPIFSAYKLEEKLKTRAIEETQKNLSELSNSIDTTISKNVKGEFERIKNLIMLGLSDVMAQEESNIRKMMEENQLKQLEKQKVFLLLENSKKQITQQRQELQSLLISAQQKL